MSITFAMIVLGGVLVYGGWTNRSVWALARGDNTQPKPTITAANATGNASRIQGVAGA